MGVMLDPQGLSPNDCADGHVLGYQLDLHSELAFAMKQKPKAFLRSPEGLAEHTNLNCQHPVYLETSPS